MMISMQLKKWDPYEFEQHQKIEQLAKRFNITSPQETKNALLFENGTM